MSGVTFSHPDPNVGTLRLRLPPTSVEWTYNMATSTTPTYAGEVVQILGINFDKLVITGQFGKEGPHGKDSNLDRRPIDEFRDYQGGTGVYRVGLSQMMEYFQRYFAIASQGRDAVIEGNYNQQWITLNYDGAIDVDIDVGKPEGPWQVHPISFPSFRRSNELFAPEWRVECEVVEPPGSIKYAQMQEEIARMSKATVAEGRPTPGAFNPFNDPLGQFTTADATAKAKEHAEQSLQAIQGHILDHYATMLPAVTPDELDELIRSGASIAATYSKFFTDKGN